MDLKQNYNQRRSAVSDEYAVYTQIEQVLLGVQSHLMSSTISMGMSQALGKDQPSNSWMGLIAHKIKQLAIELSRNKPTDWNQFMDVIVS